MQTVHLNPSDIVSIVNDGARSFLHPIIDKVELGDQLLILGSTYPSQGRQDAQILIEVSSKRLYAFPFPDGYRVLYDFRLIHIKITNH